MSITLVVFCSILAAALVSMPVFALLGRGRDVDAERRGSQFLLGAGDFLVHWFMWAISPLERGSLRLGLSPDFFNFAGLGFGLLGAVPGKGKNNGVAASGPAHQSEPGGFDCGLMRLAIGQVEEGVG